MTASSDARPAPADLDQLAARLAATVPEADRPAATRALATVVLPWELRSLASSDDPGGLVRVVHDGLAGALAEVPPAQRLTWIARRALGARGQRALADATELAVRRYALDHPDRAAAAMERIATAQVAALTRPEVESRARTVSADLDEIEQASKAAGPDAWELNRITVMQARMAAGSARTGSFATSMGGLADVLRELGEPTDELRVH